MKLRLGTYNVQNMVDSVNDPETNDGVRKKTPQAMAAIARILEDSQVDVVSLQEIENIDILKELMEYGNLQKLFPHFKLVEGNDQYKGYDVAVLSKYPIKRFVTHSDKAISKEDPSKRFKRDLLEVDVELPNKKSLRVFANHFVAQTERKTEYYDRWRESEAEAAIRIVKRQAKKFPVDYYAVMGDFNGDDNSRVMRLFEEEPTLHNSSRNLEPSWGVLKVHDTFSPSRLDHIVVGEKLHRKVIDAGVFQHPDAALASDHSLVYTDFELVA